jgi:hypothetical protein
MRIVSVPGRLVRDPATRRPVDETGIDVDPTDLHWARLIADGDVAPAPDDAEPEPDEAPAPDEAPPAPEEAPAKTTARRAPAQEA